MHQGAWSCFRGSNVLSRGDVQEPRGRSREASALVHGAQELGGEHGRLGAALESELGQDAGDVVLHRLLGQEHPLADLAVGEALGDQAEQLQLLLGELGAARAPWPDRCAPGRAPGRSAPGRSASCRRATWRTAPTRS